MKKILFFSLLIYICCVCGCKNSSKESNVDSSIDETDPAYIMKRDSLAKAILDSSRVRLLKKEWDFKFEKDEMTDDTNIWAMITSLNTIEQDFPYGKTEAYTTIRYMKKYGGYSAIVSVSSGQIYGSSYSDENYVMARFDDEKPIKYWFDESSDNSSNLVFIRNKMDFIARCKKATSIKIEIPLYQAGRCVFKFKVNKPLVWREE